MSLPIIYKDEDLLVVDKPWALLSVPGRGEHKQDCAQKRLETLYGEVGVVHRLDWATSGVMVFARNATSLKRLNRQFEKRVVSKGYLAWVMGRLPEQGRVDLPLNKDWPNRPRQKIDFEDGKPSLTSFRLLRRLGDMSLVALTPHTGRSHQLRMHMAALGTPIAGDRLYLTGERLARASRTMLHAHFLEFYHPITDKRVRFIAPCPFV